MNAASTSATRWSISTRTTGEVLVARASLPVIELVQLGVPTGFTPAEIEGWLRDLAGVAVETSRGDTRARGIPALLHHALTGLLFSQAELWNLSGGALPCSVAMVETPEGPAFGWVGGATVQVFADDVPTEPQWVLVRDDGGREARAAWLPAGARVRVVLEFRPGAPGADAPAAMEAEWYAAPATTQTGPIREIWSPEAELDAVPMPATPVHEMVPSEPPGLATWNDVASEPGAAIESPAPTPALAPASLEPEAPAPLAHEPAGEPIETLAAPEPGEYGHPVARWLGKLLGWARRSPRPAPTFAEPPFSEPAAQPPISAYDELISAPPEPAEQTQLALAEPEPPPPMFEPATPVRAEGARAEVVRRMDQVDASVLPVLSVPATSIEASGAPLEVEREPVGADTGFAMPRLPRREAPPPPPPIVVRAPAFELPPLATATPQPPTLTAPDRLAPAAPPTPPPAAMTLPPAPAPAAPPLLEPTTAAPAPPAMARPELPTPLRVPHGAAAAPGPPVLRVSVSGRSPEGPPVLRVAPEGATAPAPPMPLEPAAPTPAPVTPARAEAAARPQPLEPLFVNDVVREPAFAPAPPARPAQVPARRAPRSWPVMAEPPRRSRRVPPALWGWAAAVAVVFAVGWIVGTGANGTGDERGPLARAIAAIGLGPPRYVATITSTPSGAWIAVDGKDAARRTPARVELAPGAHSITLSLPELGGASTTVRGERNDKVVADLSLEGGIEVYAADATVPITVALDGRPLGYAPLKLDSVMPGLHELQFSGPGMPAWAQPIQVGVRRTEQIVARPMSAPSNGVIQVQATLSDDKGTAPLAGAQVWVDGELRGVTPASFELPRGPHSLRLAWHGEDPPVQVIDLPGGNQRFASFAFGVDTSPPRLSLLGAVHPSSADQTSVVAVAVDGLAASDVRESWLHVRAPEGLWRRYAATVLSGGAGSVLVCVFPPAAFDAQGLTKWYLSVATQQGDEYFTELQTASIVRPPAATAAAPAPTTPAAHRPPAPH